MVRVPKARRAPVWPLVASLALASPAARAAPAFGGVRAAGGVDARRPAAGVGCAGGAGDAGERRAGGPRPSAAGAGVEGGSNEDGAVEPRPAPAGAAADGGTVGAAGARPPRSPWAVGAAVVPGLVAHGAGHYVAGERRTAGRLLALEGAGVLATGGGLTLLAVTGASRRLVGPVAAATFVGVGLFAVSALADLYGVLAPPGGAGEPPRVAPTFAAELGVRHVYDPVFPYRAFAYQALEVRAGAWRAGQSGWYSLGGYANRRLRLEGARRLLGPRPAANGGPSAEDGSFLDVEVAATDHDYAPEGFAITTGEASVRGRLDLARVGPTLAGSFAEFGVGGALAANRYDRHSDEADGLLLGGFAFGVYLGRGSAAGGGEAKLYYDHRHDGYAAGLKMRGLGSGVPGHLGARAVYFFAPAWGAAVEAEAGSAYVTGLSVLYRYGVSP
jgi:hypothetical protein